MSARVATQPIPGPRGSALLGMGNALRSDILGTLLAGFRAHGDVVAYPIGPVNGPRALRSTAVAVYHPDAVRRVFTDSATFSRRTPSIRALTEMFGEGLVTTDGETWKRQRRTVQPLFTPQRVSHYAPLMQKEADRLVDEEMRVGHTSGVVELAPVMERYALRVLGRTIFHDEEGVDEAVEAFARLIPLVGDVVRTRATQIPKLPLTWSTGRNRQFNETRAELYDIVDAFLARRDGQVHADEGDLLGRLRAGRDPQSGRSLSRQEIRDQALIFLVAGFTTTSNALTLTLYLLGRHPEVQDAVAAAAREERTSTDPHPLVLGAIQESMRLYPSAYVIARRAENDTQIGGYDVPSGSNVLVSPWVTHRHPAFWRDPETYEPARFTRGEDVSRYAYFPFGAGPRKCVGEHFALLEAVILLRAIISRYELTSHDEELPLKELISMRPSGPVKAGWRAR